MEERLALSSSGGSGLSLQTVMEDPISMEIMTNAVVLTACGHSFSEATLEGWLGSGKQFCPICQVAVRGQNAVKPNFTLREVICQYQRVRLDHETKTLAQEEAEIRTAVQTATTAAPLLQRDLSTWAQINASGDMIDDFRLLVDVLGVQGVERGDKRDVHVGVRYRGVDRRTASTRHATPTWRGELLSFALDESAIRDVKDDDFVAFALVEQTGILFSKGDSTIGTARVSLKDVVAQRRLSVLLPLVANRTTTRMLLSARCQVVNMRYASTVVFADELAKTAAFEGEESSKSGSSKEKEEAVIKANRERLVAKGRDAASTTAARVVPATRSVSVPVPPRPNIPLVAPSTPAPAPPSVPAPPPPPHVAAPVPPATAELERKVRHLAEMGFDAEWARRELINNGGDEEDAVERMIG